MDDRISTTTLPGGSADTRHFIYAPDGRVLGEYGTSATDMKAEFIWLSPEVGDSSAFGGDDGLGGYMPLAVATTGGTLSWVHANHMGVPALYTDASGAAIPPPTGYSAPGFPGQSRTPGLLVADLYYNRYRDYDPSTGRYIQADPIGLDGGASPYSYAMNNPLRYTDPTGEFVPLLVIGFLVGFDANLIYQRTIGGKRAWQPWKNEHCEQVDIDFWEAAEWGAIIASVVPVGRVLKGSEFLFGRHKVGIFNRNNFFRVGKGWKGYPKGSPKGQGREVFRAAFGHRSWPKIPFLPRFPWHF
jgi:RHS repeat-associated protein